MKTIRTSTARYRSVSSVNQTSLPVTLPQNWPKHCRPSHGQRGSLNLPMDRAIDLRSLALPLRLPSLLHPISTESRRRTCSVHVKRISAHVSEPRRAWSWSWPWIKAARRAFERGTTSVCNRSVPLQVAVVARRRSEGTHPINKTTRVTIEFNRGERTGSRRQGFSWTAARHKGRSREGGWKGERRGNTRPEVNPRARIRHYCLLSRTSIPYERDGLFTALWLAIQKREEPLSRTATPAMEFVLFAGVNDTDFSPLARVYLGVVRSEKSQSDVDPFDTLGNFLLRREGGGDSRVRVYARANVGGGSNVKLGRKWFCASWFTMKQ